MPRLPIRTFPDPILKTVAKECREITAKDRALARDMIETMYADEGVGLAAPQVGVSKRLIVISPRMKRGEERVFFNPVIRKKSGECFLHEGCLSIPGISAEIKRAEVIELEALDLDGKPVAETFRDFPARVIQHETDHLDGILFIDRLKMTQREELVETYRDTRIL